MIQPTIGRKVWFYPRDNDPAVVRYGLVGIDQLPCDATVIYPWGDDCINVRVTDHAGNTLIRTSVHLCQGDEAPDPNMDCATWMTYQLGQAAKTEALQAQAAKLPT